MPPHLPLSPPRRGNLSRRGPRPYGLLRGRTCTSSCNLPKQLDTLQVHQTDTLQNRTTTARAAPPLDALTARTHLTSALARFLGLAGTAIPVDLLRLDGREAWVRVPTADARAVVAAVGGWVGREGGNGEEGNDNDDAAAQIGWRVRARSTWLRGLISATGEEAAWKEVE